MVMFFVESVFIYFKQKNFNHMSKYAKFMTIVMLKCLKKAVKY